MLKGLKIILGVSGGIAAYKACETLRLLQKQGAEVKVLMTRSATKMVGIETFQALSQNKVVVDVFNDSRESDWFEHIDLSRWADLMLIAPATANTIGHLAGGTTPDMLSLMAMATQAPKMICPAMNTIMLNSPAVQRNLKLLAQDSYHIVSSGKGILACGEIGEGRLPEPSEIVDEVISWQLSQRPKLEKVLITAGRTHEPIDPVRYISNTSSGVTGLTFAKELMNLGYEVKLLCGPVDVPIDPWIDCERFQTTAELESLMKQHFPTTDVLLQAAAVADYRPAEVSATKIKGSRSTSQISLIENPDLLKTFSEQAHSGQYIIGFALETDNIVEHAVAKLNKKGCHLLVVNNPVQSHSGFGKTEVFSGLLSQGESQVELQLQSKEQLAIQVAQRISNFFSKA